MPEKDAYRAVNPYGEPPYTGLSFEDRFSMLVDAEWTRRKSNRLLALIRAAGYAAANACVEDISYAAQRQLDKAQILRLASCAYIEQAHNVVILGATGTGKTYLACALGIAANRNYYSTKYIRLPDLLVEIAMARGDGTYRELMRKYRKYKLLILDEWVLYPLKESEARDLPELIEARSQVASTIFCSQFDIPGWHELLYDPTMADAICDRIVYNSHVLTIKGESMRRLNAISEWLNGVAAVRNLCGRHAPSMRNGCTFSAGTVHHGVRFHRTIGTEYSYILLFASSYYI